MVASHTKFIFNSYEFSFCVHYFCILLVVALVIQSSRLRLVKLIRYVHIFIGMNVLLNSCFFSLRNGIQNDILGKKVKGGNEIKTKYLKEVYMCMQKLLYILGVTVYSTPSINEQKNQDYYREWLVDVKLSTTNV